MRSVSCQVARRNRIACCSNCREVLRWRNQGDGHVSVVWPAFVPRNADWLIHLVCPPESTGGLLSIGHTMAIPTQEEIHNQHEHFAKWASDKLPPVGPRQIVILTCNGCPAYKTERWREQLENDEVDRGTSSTCEAVNRGITCYAEPAAPVPAWCPQFANPQKE